VFLHQHWFNERSDGERCCAVMNANTTIYRFIRAYYSGTNWVTQQKMKRYFGE